MIRECRLIILAVQERNQQGIENQLIKPEGFESGRGGKMQKTTRWTVALLFSEAA